MLSEGYGASLLGGDWSVGDVWFTVVCVGVWQDSTTAPRIELFLRFATPLFAAGSLPSGFLLATGLERPLSLPRLATPTPHVNVVLYPEQSFPISMHGVQ
jgi:hypothetical protein